MCNSPLSFISGSHLILRTHRVHGTTSEWCFGSIVQWYHGSGGSIPLPHPLQLLCCRCHLNLRRVKFLTTPCYWCDLLQDLGCPRSQWYVLFSDFHFLLRAIYLTSLFSDTHHVLSHYVFTRRNLTGQLYLVCRDCWIRLSQLSTLCEPCGGCEFFDSVGFDFNFFPFPSHSLDNASFYSRGVVHRGSFFHVSNQGRDATRTSPTSLLKLSRFHFFLIVTQWMINHRLIRCNNRLYVIQFAPWI